MSLVVAVVGATGLVGREMLRTLEQRAFPTKEVRALASARSAGATLQFRDESLQVAAAAPEQFEGVDVALFSAGRSVARELCPAAAAQGAVVIDNSSGWRMDPDVPLVVPEVNPEAVKRRPKGIIANPNCSTIQMVVALGPIHELSPIEHIVVSTYQATSGKGQAAVDELHEQIRALAAGRPVESRVFPSPIAQNVVMDWPRGDDDWSEEELKMVHETRKILEDDNIGVTATTVRVPVFFGHSESVNVETRNASSAAEVRAALEKAPGVAVVDDPAGNRYPLAIDASGQDMTLVGRIRNDESIPNAVNLWIVADNIRKGAATNAVQIAEILAKEYL